MALGLSKIWGWYARQSPPRTESIQRNQNMSISGRGLVWLWWWGCRSTHPCEALDSSIKRGPAEGSLLPLASCNLHLSNNPFHYVAPTSMLSTDRSRFLDDTHRTAGVEWSCREMLGRSVGPLRKEDILHLEDVRSGQVLVLVVRLSAKAALSNYSLHLYSSACSIVSIRLSSSWNDSQNCGG